MKKKLFEQVEPNEKQELFQNINVEKIMDESSCEDVGKKEREETGRDECKPSLFEQIEKTSELSGQPCKTESHRPLFIHVGDEKQMAGIDAKDPKCQREKNPGDIESTGREYAGQGQQNLQGISHNAAKAVDSSTAISYIKESSCEGESIDNGMCMLSEQDYVEIYGMVNRMVPERGNVNSMRNPAGFVGGVNLAPNYANRVQNLRGITVSEEIEYVNGRLIGNVNGKEFVVGNFWVEIFVEIERKKEICDETNEIIRIDSERFLKVGIFTEQKQYLGEIKQDELYKFQWILRLSEHRARYEDDSAAKRMLRKYLHKLILEEKFSKYVEFASTGWKEEDGKFYYVTSDGVVGHPEMPVSAVDGSSFFGRSAEKLEVQKAVKEYISMRKIISGKQKNAVVLQNYTLTSVLTTIFSKAGFPPKFVLAVIGKTNSKKTTCAVEFCKVFNRKKGMGVDINFNSSEAALYDIMDEHSDAVVIIDDFVPEENSAEARLMKKKLEMIERAYGDRSPRKRCVTFSKNKDAKSFIPVRGCALITGETFVGKKSSQSRVIRLNFEPDDVNTEILSGYQKELGIIPTVIEDFIKFVSENVDYVMRIVGEAMDYWRKKLQNSIETPRFRDAFGVFAATAQIFGAYLKEKKIFSDDYVEHLVDSDLEEIFSVVKENDDDLRDADPFTAFVESIHYALTKQQLYLAAEKNFNDFDRITEYLIETDGFYLIGADKLYECAKNYFAYTGRYFPYKSRREIVNVLAQAGVILEKYEGQKKRHTHKASVGGKTVNNRFLHIYKEKIENVGEYIENI